MERQYPNTVDGDVLQRIAEDGNDMSKPMRIDFHIDYAFSNPVLALLARSNADMAIKRIMEAFLGEADNRYGPPVSAQQV